MPASTFRRVADTIVANPLALALLMLAVALAARAAQFGNPVVHVDDQFYLLAGERLLHGALPFVDLWDRKPVGLFLLYAWMRSLGGDAVLTYQLVATAFAAATAWVIARTARMHASPHGAAAAGIVYLLFLGLFGGEGGQAPVFYNLPVALAGWAVAKVIARPGFDARSFALGLLATALMGIAIQIKTSVVFEGAFFGIALLWEARRVKVRLPILALAAVAWAAAGLAPTLVAWGWYAAHGHGEAFVFANFLSIFARGSEAFGILLKRLVWMAAMLSPLLVAAWLAGRAPANPEGEARGFFRAWAAAAIGAVLIFGSYFDHYALPLLVPLCLAAAPLLAHREGGVAILAPGFSLRVPAGIVLMLYGTAMTAMIVDQNRKARGWGPQAQAIAEFVRPRLQGCLYVYDGDVALYRMTHSCLPTRWPFPDHFNNKREDGAVGVDSLAEVRRIMAGRPDLVVSGAAPQVHANRRTWDFMQGELARAYAPAFTQRAGGRDFIVYQRRPGF